MERLSNKKLFRKGETENDFYIQNDTYLAESRISRARFMEVPLGKFETRISLAKENVEAIRPHSRRD